MISAFLGANLRVGRRKSRCAERVNSYNLFDVTQWDE
jgi:hypothetical protein